MTYFRVTRFFSFLKSIILISLKIAFVIFVKLPFSTQNCACVFKLFMKEILMVTCREVRNIFLYLGITEEMFQINLCSPSAIEGNSLIIYLKYSFYSLIIFLKYSFYSLIVYLKYSFYS